MGRLDEREFRHSRLYYILSPRVGRCYVAGGFIPRRSSGTSLQFAKSLLAMVVHERHVISAFLLTPTPSPQLSLRERKQEGKGGKKDQSQLLIKRKDVQHPAFVGVFAKFTEGTHSAKGCGRVIGCQVGSDNQTRPTANT